MHDQVELVRRQFGAAGVRRHVAHAHETRQLSAEEVAVGLDDLLRHG
jgi:hypothetical protein